MGKFAAEVQMDHTNEFFEARIEAIVKTRTKMKCGVKQYGDGWASWTLFGHFRHTGVPRVPRIQTATARLFSRRDHVEPCDIVLSTVGMQLADSFVHRAAPVYFASIP